MSSFSAQLDVAVREGPWCFLRLLCNVKVLLTLEDQLLGSLRISSTERDARLGEEGQRDTLIRDALADLPSA
jgi:hypothetical protein